MSSKKANQAQSNLPSEADYHKTKTYKGLDEADRKLLAQYKRETGISNEQLFYQFYLEDLKDVSEEDKKTQNNPGEMTLIGAALLSVFAVSSGSEVGIFCATIVLVITFILFITGRFNSYETEKRRVRRRLKKLPDIPSFEDWRAGRE